MARRWKEERQDYEGTVSQMEGFESTRLGALKIFKQSDIVSFVL